jgi:sugar O-acyltransferase (sialic acid O-acetyltransferase NeuD family)
MKNIVLFGGGNQLSYTLDILEKENKYNIVGIVDSVHEIGTSRFGYPVLGRQSDFINIRDNYYIDGGIVTIGDNWARFNVSSDIIRAIPDFQFINAIHPSVIISNSANIGVGVVAMAGCIINPNSTIGNFTFFATGAQIEHDCTIEDYASVSAGSVLGGHVHVKKFAAVTLNVTIIDRISIGENSVVGAGSVVTRSIPDNVVCYGSPAKIVRNREKNEKFLK